MRAWLIRSCLALGLGLLAIQLVPVVRTNPPLQSDIPAAADVKGVLRRACYDCHSNETVWPWYSRVAPVSWLVVSDVDQGRRQLDFSAWDAYSERQRARKIRKIWEKVQEGHMPPWYYLALHRDARLSERDRAIVRQWVGGAS